MVSLTPLPIQTYQGDIWKYFPSFNRLVRGDTDLKEEPSPLLKRVILPFSLESFRQLCTFNLNEMILSLMENCNMRCKYCTYCESFPDERNFSQKVMSEKTGRDAIDWFVKNSSKSPAVNISFFGGEPLLEFTLLSHLYDYAKEKIHDKKITFMISTNGTLFNKRVLTWLSEHKDVYLTLTLNGPENLHDLLRVFKNGGPTHRQILSQIPDLLAVLKNEKRLQIQCNYRDMNDVIIQHKYFRKEHLFANARVYYAKITLPSSQKNRINWQGLSDRANEAVIDHIRKMTIRDAHKLKKLPSVSLWETSYLPQLAASTNKKITFPVIGHQGCCTPIYTRINIDVDGNIFLCEKTNNTPILGNVSCDGIEISAIEKLISDCNRLFEKAQCANCPAVFFCHVCFNHMYRNQKIVDCSVLKPYCSDICRDFQYDLKWYCSLYDENPTLLKFSQIDPSKKQILDEAEKSAYSAIQSYLSTDQEKGVVN